MPRSPPPFSSSRSPPPPTTPTPAKLRLPGFWWFWPGASRDVPSVWWLWGVSGMARLQALGPGPAPTRKHTQIGRSGAQSWPRRTRKQMCWVSPGTTVCYVVVTDVVFILEDRNFPLSRL